MIITRRDERQTDARIKKIDKKPIIIQTTAYNLRIVHTNSSWIMWVWFVNNVIFRIYF